MLFGIVSCLLIFVLGFHCQKEVIFDFKANNNRQFITVSENSTYMVTVHNIPFSAASILFEIHSHIDNITLSNSKETCLHCFVTGNNIGMVYKLQSSESEARMWLLNKIQKNISCLIIISVLDSDDLIPGGCNMEFATEIAPYLKLRNEFGRLYLEFQHASFGSFRDEPITSCSFSLLYITYEIYVLHLEENNFSEKEYFAKIIIMSNLSLMKEQSSKVVSYAIHPDTRFTFLMYPNVGVIYNVLAKYTVNGKTTEKCYVPVSTYGCGASEFTEYGCTFTYVLEEKAFLFLLSIYGFIICYFGHLFYKSSMFFFGFLTLFFITLLLLGRYSIFSRSKILVLSGICGILGGILWLAFWLWLHNFVISLTLVGFVFGFLVTATILYTPLGNLELFLNEKNYWLFLATGSLLATVLFLGSPNLLSVLATSIVGSYVMLLFYDDFIGTRLSYIILNIVKRGISKRSDFASNEYPFELRDAVMFAAWFIAVFSGILVQSRRVFKTSFMNTCCSRFCSCTSKNVNPSISQLPVIPESDPHQRLLNDDSVFYNTFPK